MENAHTFAKGMLDERRFNLHLVRFPERILCRGTWPIQAFSCRTEVALLMTPVDETVLHGDFLPPPLHWLLRGWNLKRKSEIKKTEPNSIDSSGVSSDQLDLHMRRWFQVLPKQGELHAKPVQFPFSQPEGCSDLTSSMGFLENGVCPQGNWQLGVCLYCISGKTGKKTTKPTTRKQTRLKAKYFSEMKF